MSDTQRDCFGLHLWPSQDDRHRAIDLVLTLRGFKPSEFPLVLAKALNTIDNLRSRVENQRKQLADLQGTGLPRKSRFTTEEEKDRFLTEMRQKYSDQAWPHDPL